MNRTTGTYRVTTWDREEVRAFIPAPLPPDPPLVLDTDTTAALSDATAALGRLAVAADDAVASAQELFAVTSADRAKVASHAKTTVATIRLVELLPSNPIITLPLAIRLLDVSKPTAIRTIEFLQDAGILREATGKRRDRVYAYHRYLQVLTPDTE